MTDGGGEVYPHPDSLPVAPLPPHESPRTRRLNITVFAPRAVSFAGFLCSSCCKPAAHRDAINSRRDEAAAAHLKLASLFAPSSAFFFARLIPGRRSWIKWSILQKPLHPQGMNFNELRRKPLRLAFHERQACASSMWCHTCTIHLPVQRQDESSQKNKQKKKTDRCGRWTFFWQATDKCSLFSPIKLLPPTS